MVSTWPFRFQKLEFSLQLGYPLQEWLLDISRAMATFAAISVKLFVLIADHNPIDSNPASLKILTYAPLLESGEQIAETVA